MTKIDLKRMLRSYQAREGIFDIIEMPPARYLMVDGSGDPNISPAYKEALEALYPFAYKLKFASKTELDRDYVVPPLEGLWWADDMASFTDSRDKSAWSWTLMLMVPDWIEEGMVEHARSKAAEPARGKVTPAKLGEVRFEELAEGICVQTLHIGSFDNEGPVLAEMHERFIPEAGYRMSGRHHEIYLSDMRRVEPTKLRTILRQPIDRV